MLLGLQGLGLALAGPLVIPVAADPNPSETIRHLEEVIRATPGGAYAERTERGFLYLESGDTMRVQEDIDALLASRDWRAEGLHLLAQKYHDQGRLEEARARILESNRLKADPIKLRLLARVETARRDTAAAMDAWLQVWTHAGYEDDYLSLLTLYQARKMAPDKVLRRGLTLYPDRPGAVKNIFETYRLAGGETRLRACLKISRQAHETWWPRSVDWKIRHARTLVALRRPREAEPVLMAALDLLDGRAPSESGASEFKRLRREVFSLLDTVRTGS
jgi:tetratricopeptide (TPR) repeat protein